MVLALSRIGSALLTLVIVMVVVFVLIRLAPGDPVSMMLGDVSDPAVVERIRQGLGLDLSVPEQFALWSKHVLTGDLGRSIKSGEPVLPLVAAHFRVSLSIILLGLSLAVVLAIPAGMLAAWRQNSSVDFAVNAVSTLLLSIPTFWLGLLLLLLFGLKLGWLPVVGYVSVTENFTAGAVYLVMPILTLLLHELGILTRMMRASTIEVLRLDYITNARAKGQSEPAIFWRHAFKPAFAPTWSLLGFLFGNLLGGIAIIETVFTVPGFGRLLVESVYARDYPVIQACLLFIAVVYVIINNIIDLSYSIFDPRVRQQ